MKKFFNIVKVVLTLLLFVYSGLVIWIFFLMPKEERFDVAANMQGLTLSQSMFDILTYQYPDYSNAYFEQSVALNKRGEYAEGFRLLDKAVALDPKMHLGYRGYMKLRFLNDYEGALKDFDRLDSLTPNFNDAPWGEDIDFLRGEAYFGKGDYKKAISAFNRSLENQGEEWADIQTFVYLGLSEYESGNYEKAISEFHRALEQSEFTPEAYLGLAKAHQQLGDVEQAMEYILKAEDNMEYKRNDSYIEYLNEIYLQDVMEVKEEMMPAK